MVEKTQKPKLLNHSIKGRFDTKEAADLTEKLAQKLEEKSIGGAVLDFAAATIITAGGIAGLKALGEQMRSYGKELIVCGMRSELYKALKVAGASDAMTFEHRKASA